MTKVFLIAFGGGAGALARYYLSGFVQTKFGAVFPYGTLAVNLLGCFLLGLLMGLLESQTAIRPEMRTLIGIGFLGAFTTFSTFGYETVALLQDNAWLAALLNVTASVAFGLIAVYLGLVVARVAAA